MHYSNHYVSFRIEHNRILYFDSNDAEQQARSAPQAVLYSTVSGDACRQGTSVFQVTVHKHYDPLDNEILSEYDTLSDAIPERERSLELQSYVNFRETLRISVPK